MRPPSVRVIPHEAIENEGESLLPKNQIDTDVKVIPIRRLKHVAEENPTIEEKKLKFRNLQQVLKKIEQRKNKDENDGKLKVVLKSEKYSKGNLLQMFREKKVKESFRIE